MREQCLSSLLFYMDSAGSMDDVNADTGGNLGLYQRFVFTRDGQEVELESNIYADMCQQERFLEL